MVCSRSYSLVGFADYLLRLSLHQTRRDGRVDEKADHERKSKFSTPSHFFPQLCTNEKHQQHFFEIRV